MENSTGISSLVKSGLFSNTLPETVEPERHPIVVTVSRNFGSNGGKIAELLAERLKVPCFGHSMIDELISKTKTTKAMMSLMDEKLPTPLDSFIYSLFTTTDQSVVGYCKNIIKTTLKIAKSGGIIVGRGARLILAKNPHVFRIHIEGSREVCIKRVAQREGLSTADAKLKIAETEQERSRFLKGLYKSFPNNRTYYDLVINSDKIEPPHAVDIIVNAMDKMGYLDNVISSPPQHTQSDHQLSKQSWSQPPVKYELNIGLHFLIVEDEMEFFSLVNGWLSNPVDHKESPLQVPTLKLTHAKTFMETESFLGRYQFDLILLDLNLADSHGYNTFINMNQKKLDTPIIVFTGMDDEQTSIQAVTEGAQDYLVKGKVNKSTLVLSIRHALARYKIMKTYNIAGTP